MRTQINPKFGLVLSQEGYSIDEILSAAQEAEKLGFDSVWVYDHLFMSGTKNYLECFILLSAISLKTQRVKLGPLVLNNLLRHPSLVAKMGATLDQLSHGRFELGIGAGWYRRECETYGIEFPVFTERVARLAESIEIILRLWKSHGESISFQGKYYKIKDAKCLPPPYSKPFPPVFLGGRSNPILQLVVKNMLGLNIDQDWGIGPAEAQRILNVLSYYCQQMGKDLKKIRKSICLRLFVGHKESEVERQIEKWKKNISQDQSFSKRLIKGSVRMIRALSKYKSIKFIPPTSQIIGFPEDCITQISDYRNLGFIDFYIKLYDFTDFELLKIVAEEIIKPIKNGGET